MCICLIVKFNAERKKQNKQKEQRRANGESRNVLLVLDVFHPVESVHLN